MGIEGGLEELKKLADSGMGDFVYEFRSDLVAIMYVFRRAWIACMTPRAGSDLLYPPT